MNSSLNKAHDFLNTVLAKESSIQEGMEELIQYCYQASPEDKKAWDFLIIRNYEEEFYHCKRWLEERMKFDPVNKSVIDVFWFGMFNMDDNDEICGLYLAGLEFEDDDKRTIKSSPSYLPGKYMSSDVLHCLYTFTTQSGQWAFEVGEFLLCIGYSSLLIKNVCQDINVNPLLGNDEQRPVLVGIDTKEYIYLGKLSKEGWLL